LSASIEPVGPVTAGRAVVTRFAPSQALPAAAMPSLKPRAKSLIELAAGAAFLFDQRPLALDEKASALLSGDARTLLGKTREAIGAVPSWTVPVLEEAVRRVAEDAGIGLGKVAQPVRAALTGRSTSPGIFDVLVLLGREESPGRLDDSLAAEDQPA